MECFNEREKRFDEEVFFGVCYAVKWYYRWSRDLEDDDKGENEERYKTLVSANNKANATRAPCTHHFLSVLDT